jgi:putative RecB family exonuclease
VAPIFLELFTRHPRRLEVLKEQPRSVSQVTQYEACGYRYYLSRVMKVWSRPAAWSGMGTAVHSAAEEWERSGRTMARRDVHIVFNRVYSEEIARAAKDTPNWECWSASGPYGGAADTERRWRIGHEHVDRLMDVYEARNDVVWRTPDGTLGLELPFETKIGSVAVRGYIDRVDVLPDGSLVAVDYKTGAKAGEPFQLATYAYILRQEYDVIVDDGAFFMSKTGTFVRPGLADEDEVLGRFAAMDAGVKAERFDPNPSADACRFCDVSFACKFKEN